MSTYYGVCMSTYYSVCKYMCVSQGDAQRIDGSKKADSCLCRVNSSVWAFPAQQYETVLQLVEDCETTLQNLNNTVRDTLDLQTDVEYRNEFKLICVRVRVKVLVRARIKVTIHEGSSLRCRDVWACFSWLKVFLCQ